MMFEGRVRLLIFRKDGAFGRLVFGLLFPLFFLHVRLG